MASRGVRRSRSEEEEESYFISMADMMVGLLFIFIILLLYFALQFQQKSKALSNAGEVRAKILNDLKEAIAKRDRTLEVHVDPATGVLRLPAAILFAKSDYQLSPEGKRAIGVVGNAMASVLPCYTYPRRKAGCEETTHSIDAIFIEGHTDADALNGNGPIQGNLELSALRATSTYRALIAAEPGLNALHNLPADNPQSSPILSVSGYAVGLRTRLRGPADRNRDSRSGPAILYVDVAWASRNRGRTSGSGQ